MTALPIAISKVWGVTVPLIVTPMFEMHKLHILAKHRCSMHAHRLKHNAFYVLHGHIFIDSEIDGAFASTAPETAFLDTGAVYTVAPGVRHQFRTGNEPCVALEMYFTEPLSEDIIRSNVGGPV